MGSSSSKKSGLVIKLEDKIYTPGHSTKGVILLQLNENFPGTKLILKIKGQEKIKYGKKKEYKHDIYSSQQVLHQFENNYAPKGQYQFPFEFQLSEFLPGTFNDENSLFKAQIIYQVSCVLQSLNSEFKSHKDKMELIVRERENQYNVHQNIIRQQAELEPQDFCCFGYGRIKIKSSLEKFTHCNKSPVQIKLEINSRKCRKSMEKLQIKLISKCTVYIPDSNNRTSSKLKYGSNIQKSSLLRREEDRDTEQILLNNTSQLQNLKSLVKQRQIACYNFEGIRSGQLLVGENARVFDLEFVEADSKYPNTHKKSIYYRPSIYGSNFIKNEYYIQITGIFSKLGLFSQKHAIINQSLQMQMGDQDCEFRLSGSDIIQNNQDFWAPKIYDLKQVAFSLYDSSLNSSYKNSDDDQENNNNSSNGIGIGRKNNNLGNNGVRLSNVQRVQEMINNSRKQKYEEKQKKKIKHQKSITDDSSIQTECYNTNELKQEFN